jgi:hypothetical protein
LGPILKGLAGHAIAGTVAAIHLLLVAAAVLVIANLVLGRRVV